MTNVAAGGGAKKKPVVGSISVKHYQPNDVSKQSNKTKAITGRIAAADARYAARVLKVSTQHPNWTWQEVQRFA
jgi:hypothetical protein